jgi:hypothetical protein
MDLRSRLIRLAHANPDLRPELLRLLKGAETDPGLEALTQHVTKSFTQADEMARGRSGTPDEVAAERASILAITAGSYAKRKGMSEDDLKKWVSSNYGQIWVRLGGLNPGLDLKDVVKVALRAYTRTPSKGKTAEVDPNLPTQTERVSPKDLRVGDRIQIMGGKTRWGVITKIEKVDADHLAITTDNQWVGDKGRFLVDPNVPGSWQVTRVTHWNPDPESLARSLRRAGGDDEMMSKAVANGWEGLQGSAYVKASQLTGANVDVAKKFGRKTVFARFHGTVTLYVVCDDGRVAQDWFMGLPTDNAVKEFVRVSLMDPMDKTANLSLTKKDIDLKLLAGDTKVVSSLVHGPWAIYKSLKGAGYTVTFIPTGQAITTKSPTLTDAKALLEALLEKAPDLEKANDVADIMRHKDLIVEVLKNPPAMSGTARKPPVERVSDKREKVIADLKEAGLMSMGTRSGKAGDFFAARGLRSAPTRAISVGTRDVLLNTFDMYDQKWKMAKAELISAVTPELLAQWVKWVNAGPARGDLRTR